MKLSAIFSYCLPKKESHSFISSHSDTKNTEMNQLIARCFSEQQSEKVYQYANQILKKHPNVSTIDLSERLIQAFKKDRSFNLSLRHFDFELGALKMEKNENSDSTFVLIDNKIRLKKWESYGLDSHLFYKNKEFIDFFFDSYLGSQMKMTKIPHLREINGEPALLIEGEWKEANTILKEFEVRFIPTYKEKLIFKKQTNQVYTYTDTAQGLVPFHPYQKGLKTPISKINFQDYKKTLESAQKFVRETDLELADDQIKSKRTCILQIVSSHIHEDKHYSFLTRNFFNLFNRKHPWIRLIEFDQTTKEASVYAIGFGWEEKVFLPFKTILGRFRSIDPWEYQAAERVVTNIAITPEELKKLQEFPEQFIKNDRPVGFNLLTQNCSVGVRTGIAAATGILVPTEISHSSLFMRLTPDFFSKSINKINAIRKDVKFLISRVTPVFTQKGYSLLSKTILKCYQAIIAFRLTLIGTLMGSAYASSDKGADLENPTQNLKPSTHRLRYWFDLSLHKAHLPGILQEWQLKQPSTIVYPKNHKGFSIVPY